MNSIINPTLTSPPLNSGSEDHIQTSSKYLHKWWHHNLLRQPVPVPNKPSVKKLFLISNLNHSHCNPRLFSLALSLITRWKRLTSTCLWPPFREGVMGSPLSLPLRWAALGNTTTDQPQLMSFHPPTPFGPMYHLFFTQATSHEQSLSSGKCYGKCCQRLYYSPHRHITSISLIN